MQLSSAERCPRPSTLQGENPEGGLSGFHQMQEHARHTDTHIYHKPGHSARGGLARGQEDTPPLLPPCFGIPATWWFGLHYSVSGQQKGKIPGPPGVTWIPWGGRGYGTTTPVKVAPLRTTLCCCPSRETPDIGLQMWIPLTFVSGFSQRGGPRSEGTT